MSTYSYIIVDQDGTSTVDTVKAMSSMMADRIISQLYPNAASISVFAEAICG